VSASFELPSCDRITVGTLGPAGQRVFFLQAREESVLVTLKLEKSQVGALAARLGQLLHDNPATSAIPEPADLDLETPALPEWVVGSMSLSFSTEDDRVVLVCEELVFGADVDDDDDDEDEGSDEDPFDADLFDDDDERRGAVARFGCTRGQAAALAMRGATLIAVGRAACPLCSYPLDPRGHVCPKTNGHSPPRL
jgi:uncharacterized repeat protein (TIGR03847 family)